MAYSLKKMWTAMAVSLLATTSFVNAQYDGNMYDGCCPCPPSCCDNNCGDFWVEADAIFFRANEDGLHYGSRVQRTTAPGPLVTDRVRTRSVDPTWETGFRIGVGYQLPCDCWEIAAYWTRFHHKNSNRHHFDNASATDFFIPAWGDDFVGAGTFINRARAHWKLNLDLLDVELGRSFCCSPCFTLKPFIGIRAGWIKQKFRPEYFTTDTAGTLTSVGAFDLESKFDGVGIRGGLDTEFKFGCGFSLYGCAAANVLYGEQHSDFDGVQAFGTPTGTFVENQRHHYKRCLAITDAAIGLRYRTSFWCDSMALTIQLGYEHHYFFNKNRFENSVILSGQDQSFSRGDLCLHGVTLGARLDF